MARRIQVKFLETTFFHFFEGVRKNENPSRTAMLCGPEADAVHRFGSTQSRKDLDNDQGHLLGTVVALFETLKAVHTELPYWHIHLKRCLQNIQIIWQH
jgi:hypothetical protein